MSKSPNLPSSIFNAALLLVCCSWLTAQDAPNAESSGAEDEFVLEEFVLPGAEAADSSQTTEAGEASIESEDGEEVFLMPEFTVSVEKDEGYYSAHTLGGTRTSALIKDTPMTIGVVNAELMADLGFTDINDLAGVLAGVETELDSGFNDRVVKFRGLNTRNQLYEFLPRGIDQDSYNIDRSEIIRGSNSLIYGQADPGGKINFLGKRAHFGDNETTIGNKFGSNGLIRWNLDSNYVVNDKLAIRTMGAYQKTGAHLDNKEKIFQGITLEATYRLSNKTQFRLHLEQARGKRSGGSYNLLEDNTFNTPFRNPRGSTGIPVGIPLHKDIVDYMPDAMINDIINFTDGVTTPGAIDAGVAGNPPDYFSNKQDLEDYFARLSAPHSRDNLGEFRGDDVFREIKGYYFIGEMVHAFTDDLNLKLVLGHEKSNTDARAQSSNNVVLTSNNDIQGANGNNPTYRNNLNYLDTNEPLGGSGGIAGAAWNIQDPKNTFDDSYSLRSTLSWHKELWGTEQQFLFSYDFDRKEIGKEVQDLLINGATVNADGSYAGNQVYRESYVFADRTEPLDFDPSLGEFHIRLNQESDITTHALWFANQGKYFNGRLNTLVGARFDMINTQSLTDDVKSGNDASGGVPLELEEDFHQVSPTIGFLVALTDHVGFFANYSQSIQSPNGFDTDPFGNILSPEIGTGYEGGFKFEALDGKLNGQLVAYQITKEHEINRFSSAEAQEVFPISDPANAVLYDDQGNYDPIGQNRTDGQVVETRGIEFSANYNPTREISLMLGYAYIDAEIIESDLERLEGNRQNGYSPHSATFTARYSFRDGTMKGTYCGTNIKYKSPALFGTYRLSDGQDVELELDDSIITNVFVGWKGAAWWSKNKKTAPILSVQLNVNNVFNDRSLLARGSGNSSYTAPRSYTISSSIKF